MDCGGSGRSNYWEVPCDVKITQKEKEKYKYFVCDITRDTGTLLLRVSGKRETGFPILHLATHFTAALANVFESSSLTVPRLGQPSITSPSRVRVAVEEVIKSPACYVNKAMYTKRTKEESLSF